MSVVTVTGAVHKNSGGALAGRPLLCHVYERSAYTIAAPLVVHRKHQYPTVNAISFVIRRKTNPSNPNNIGSDLGDERPVIRIAVQSRQTDGHLGFERWIPKLRDERRDRTSVGVGGITN